jgi:hypothetical protein
MVIRVALVTVLALAAMTAISNGTLLRRAGLKASCTVVRHTVGGSSLESCRGGWFDGMPNLANRGCTELSVTGKQAYWSCPSGS